MSAGLSAVERGPLRGVGAGLLADLLLALPGRLAAADAAEVSVLAQATQSLIAACLLTGAPVPPHGIAGDLAKERVRQGDPAAHRLGAADARAARRRGRVALRAV